MRGTIAESAVKESSPAASTLSMPPVSVARTIQSKVTSAACERSRDIDFVRAPRRQERRQHADDQGEHDDPQLRRIPRPARHRDLLRLSQGEAEHRSEQVSEKETEHRPDDSQEHAFEEEQRHDALASRSERAHDREVVAPFVEPMVERDEY